MAWCLVPWVLALVLPLTGCVAPIGTTREPAQRAYTRANFNALGTSKPSAETVSLLHRYGLKQLAASHPDEAVRQLHQKALATGERDLVFALAEMSYVAGDHIRRSVKWADPRDARDFYLGSAVYAWLYLFGEGKGPAPSPFDRRFREACDLYNYGLGLALADQPKGTNATIQLKTDRRRLPVGEMALRLSQTGLTSKRDEFDQFLLADLFRARGLSQINREAGLGAPLIAVRPADPVLGVKRAMPASAFLRLEGSLEDFAAGKGKGTLELYSDDVASVEIGQAKVPLEFDLSTPRAYTLNHSLIWKLGALQFLAPAERFPSQLILFEPYEPGRIPVVFVHGTFSSPVTWAQMGNTLTGDPELRRRYQFWSFMYGSGQPLNYTIGDLRAALSDEVEKLDPSGTNAALRQMVIIGHSQGGLVAKGASIDTGDRLWRIVSTNRFEDAKVPEADRAELRRLFFLKPLPFVRRVVFIATPHRGSYLSGSFIRRWAQRLVSLPGAVVSRGKATLHLTEGSETGKFLNGRIPTSLDSMSPKNPALLVMAQIPVSPPIKANSIIAVQGKGDYHQGKDGLVTYQSAHVDYAESEFIVRSFHTCLDQPATIEEVRRILHENLDQAQDELRGK